MRYFRNQRRTPPPLVREVAKRSTERVAGVIPFGDATEDMVEENAKSSPGEGDKLVEAVSIPDVAPVVRNTRTSRTDTELLDHGRDLTGQRDDDHNLYYRHDGLRALTGNVSLGAATRDFTYLVGTTLRFTSNATATQHLVVKTQSAAFPPYLTCDGGSGGNTSMLIYPEGTGTVAIKNLRFTGTATFTGAQHDHEDAAGGGTLDHGDALTGKGDDDHTQYHNDARGDARYYTETELDAGQLDNRYFTEAEHLDSSAGAGDVGKPIKLDAGGHVDATMLNDGDIDHGSVGGLADDDHTQYLRADGTRDISGNILITGANELHIRDTNTGMYSSEAGFLNFKAATGITWYVTGAALFGFQAQQAWLGSYEEGVDYVFNFLGETNQGSITWMEDEARFDLNSDVDVDGDITLTGTVDGEDVAAVGALAASALQDVVDDTSPELGGEMDAGAHTIGFTQQTATGDGTTTIDWRLGNKFKFTFGAQNDTFTFTAPSNPCNLILMLIQDGVGAGRIPTWPATVKWPGGVAPAVSSGADDVDVVSFYYDGTNYYGQIALNFA